MADSARRARAPREKGSAATERTPRAEAAEAPDAAARRGIGMWLREPTNLIFGALLLAHVAILWAFPRVPTQDGPSHVANAVLLREYSDPARPLLRDYYEMNWTLEPNWFSHAALAGLLSFFPPATADRILLSLYALLLPLSARFALSAVRPGSEFLSLLAFPFVFNFLFSMGFYNFIFSLPLFFSALALIFRKRGRFDMKGTALLAALVSILYFCHVTTFLLTFLASILVVLAFAAAEAAAVAFTSAPAAPSESAAATETAGGAARSGRFAAFLRHAASRLMPLGVAFLPGLVMTAVFISRKGASPQGAAPRGDLFRRLVFLDSLGSHDPRESFGATALAALIGVLVVAAAFSWLRERRFRPADILPLAAAIFIAIYLLAPDRMSGGEFISHRMNLFPWLTLVIWLAAHEWGRIARSAAMAAGAAIAIALLILHALSWSRIAPSLAEYIDAASAIEENRTILPISFAHFGRAPDGKRLSARTAVFLHASGWIAAERHAVDFGNYEAKTDFFPTRFREGKNPDEIVALRKDGMESSPPCVDFTEATRRAGISADYVLLWQPEDAPRGHPCAEAIFDQLRAGYVLVRTSKPRGLMQVWRR